MMRKASFIRGTVFIAFGILSQVTLAAPGTPGSGHPGKFTLAATGGDPAPILFTLAPGLALPTAYADPLGSSSLETFQNTAFGLEALFSNTSIPGGNTAFGYRALYYNTMGD